jgi:glutamyl/glutaminyl-tRNA synthetase
MNHSHAEAFLDEANNYLNPARIREAIIDLEDSDYENIIKDNKARTIKILRGLGFEIKEPLNRQRSLTETQKQELHKELIKEINKDEDVYISHCCHSEVDVEINEGEGQMDYFCKKCGEPCDYHLEKKRNKK